MRWRCGWMFLSVPQTCPSPPSLINCLSQTLASNKPLGTVRRNPACDWTEIPPKRVLKSGYTRSVGNVNCYQTWRGRFRPSCDISATKPQTTLMDVECSRQAENRVWSEP